jgi:hypothetical protein
MTLKCSCRAGARAPVAPALAPPLVPMSISAKPNTILIENKDSNVSSKTQKDMRNIFFEESCHLKLQKRFGKNFFWRVHAI